MLDDLRDEFSTSFEEQAAVPPFEPTVRRRKTGQFLGMTAFQRFVLAFLLMLVTCLLGTMLLVVTGKFGLF
ncbi:MAG: hypothetical protein ACP5QU_09330 [Anaerolineae bacterium]